MRPALSDLWWKNAVVYCLDVETFMDGDGDGTGDLPGLISRLPYLSALGVTCLWLMPLHPTAGRDDGYDVTDYYAVDPRLGTLGEFVEMVRSADELGMRVVLDLVVNHTSTDHPWFRSARSSRSSPHRDWYVWADDPAIGELPVIFPDQEDSAWEWDEQAGQYYLHRFYASQPDLNVANPAVRQEIDRIMGFWLQLGVSGFRVDAAPYLIGGVGIEDQMPEDPHAVLEGMRGFLTRRRGDAVLLGEVNLPADERTAFFGDAGDEMTGLFDFLVAGSVVAALARGDATVLADQLRTRPAPPRTCQWLNFLRNHDELNLHELPDGVQRDVFAAFAPESGMRLYGRGVRRRLPPMLGGDQRQVELAYVLLLSLPGTPVLFYGEEIGMGEDLSLEGRTAVRTPMQWSDEVNGGFSTAPADALTRPARADGPYGYRAVNVADQRARQGSLLDRVQRAVRVRKECPELGWGDATVLDVGDRRVLAHRVDWLGGRVVALHNVSGDDVEVRLRLEDDVEALLDVLGSTEADRLDPRDPRVPLPPYGYRWLRAERGAARPAVS